MTNKTPNNIPNGIIPFPHLDGDSRGVECGVIKNNVVSFDEKLNTSKYRQWRNKVSEGKATEKEKYKLASYFLKEMKKGNGITPYEANLTVTCLISASSDGGVAGASWLLGQLCEYAIIIDKNINCAADLYEKAAKQGHHHAQNNLGWLYFKGLGFQRDYNQARKWFMRAATGGVVQAQLRLGKMYLKGTGVAADSAYALVWIDKAAGYGDEEAKQLQKKIREERASKREELED